MAALFSPTAQPNDLTKLFLDRTQFWIQKVLVPIVVLFGVVGNLVTVVVLTRRRMSSSTNTYLTALAVSDLLYLIFILTLSFEHYDIDQPHFILYWEYWRFGVWFTDATRMVLYVVALSASTSTGQVVYDAAGLMAGSLVAVNRASSASISVWLTVSFTLERYIAVCHPLRGKVLCTESRARRVIVLVTVLCLLTTCTTPFEWQINTPQQGLNTTNITHLRTSSSLGLNMTYRAIFYGFWSFAFVILPLILLGIFNSFLINAVRRSQKQRIDLTQVENSGSIQREKQENKITMTLIAVVCLFMICQIPTAVMLIILVFYEPPKGSAGSNILRGFGNIFNFLVAINAACNFLLYCAMSDKYRQTLIFTFAPCLVSRHHRSHTITSNASYRHSSMRNISTNR